DAELLLVPPGARDLHRGPPGRDPPPRDRAREHALVDRLPAQRLDVATLARGRRGTLREDPGRGAAADRARQRGTALPAGIDGAERGRYGRLAGERVSLSSVGSDDAASPPRCSGSGTPRWPPRSSGQLRQPPQAR